MLLNSADATLVGVQSMLTVAPKDHVSSTAAVSAKTIYWTDSSFFFIHVNHLHIQICKHKAH